LGFRPVRGESCSRTRISVQQALQQLVSRHRVSTGDIGENGRNTPHAQRIVAWNGGHDADSAYHK
jgi:hypothetical protein